MIECIFSIDYEIYGNGEGSLEDLVYQPAEKLRDICDRAGIKMVVFVEAVELEKIEMYRTDPAIDSVKRQVQELYTQGHEIALHLHPQWYNARYVSGKWELDYGEYNLCTLSKERISEIVDRSIIYLQTVVASADFTPLSFRAGNWLFQPTRTAAEILAERGIKVDSSVFKGGLQHQHKLDYRRALRNGNYWKFRGHVDIPDPKGIMVELPIHTQLVPTWKLLTTKRIGLQGKGPWAGPNQSGNKRLSRLLDALRCRYPLKFDFCRMTINELRRMVDEVIQEDRHDPESYRPIVAIGHTKDLIDFETIESFLSLLSNKGVSISTFKEVYPKCIS